MSNLLQRCMNKSAKREMDWLNRVLKKEQEWHDQRVLVKTLKRRAEHLERMLQEGAEGKSEEVWDAIRANLKQASADVFAAKRGASDIYAELIKLTKRLDVWREYNASLSEGGAR